MNDMVESLCKSSLNKSSGKEGVGNNSSNNSGSENGSKLSCPQVYFELFGKVHKLAIDNGFRRAFSGLIDKITPRFDEKKVDSYEN
jgi:hypothetical protein